MPWLTTCAGPLNRSSQLQLFCYCTSSSSSFSELSVIQNRIGRNCPSKVSYLSVQEWPRTRQCGGYGRQLRVCTPHSERSEASYKKRILRTSHQQIIYASKWAWSSWEHNWYTQNTNCLSQFTVSRVPRRCRGLTNQSFYEVRCIYILSCAFFVRSPIIELDRGPSSMPKRLKKWKKKTRVPVLMTKVKHCSPVTNRSSSMWSFFLIGHACLERRVSRWEWIICSKYMNHSTLSSRHFNHGRPTRSPEEIESLHFGLYLLAHLVKLRLRNVKYLPDLFIAVGKRMRWDNSWAHPPNGHMLKKHEESVAVLTWKKPHCSQARAISATMRDRAASLSINPAKSTTGISTSLMAVAWFLECSNFSQ